MLLPGLEVLKDPTKQNITLFQVVNIFCVYRDEMQNNIPQENKSSSPLHPKLYFQVSFQPLGFIEASITLYYIIVNKAEIKFSHLVENFWLPFGKRKETNLNIYYLSIPHISYFSCLFICALTLSSLFTFPRAHLIVQDIVEEKMSFTPLDRHLVSFLFMQRCTVFAPH